MRNDSTMYMALRSDTAASCFVASTLLLMRRRERELQEYRMKLGLH